MSKVDKNDMIYFKEACDKTYATSRNIDGKGMVQQTVNGLDIFPKTKAKAVIMPDGKTLEESIQSGGSGSIIRINDVAISGNLSITTTGSYPFGISLSPNNCNVDVESVEVTSDCSEVTISNVTTSGFTLNVNSIPTATNHKLTIVVKDKIGTALTKEITYTIRQSATSLSVSGNNTLDSTAGTVSSDYSVTYGPTGFNVPVKSLQVTSNNAQLVVSDVSVNGFKLATSATSGFEATLTLTATTEAGTITATKKITVVYIQKVESVTINGQTEFTGTGSAYYTLSLLPANHNIPISKVEVTTTDSKLAVSGATESGFTLNVNGIPTATTHTITAKVTDTDGNVATGTLNVTVKQEPTALTISGSTSVDNETTNNYTISYTPNTYNVDPSTVEITSNQSSVTISNKTKTGFTLTPNCANDTTATITVKATMPSGNVITKTINVAVTCGLGYNDIEEVGVAIMCLNKKIYPTVEEWQAAGRPAANGVAISDGTHRFCIAPYNVESVCKVTSYSGTDYWGAYRTQVNGVQTVTDSASAKQDFDGISNTDAIVAQVTLSDGYFTKYPYSAAGSCDNYIFPNGTHGYLGACGEWKLVQDSIDKINTLMNAIGEKIETKSSAYPFYWSSTQYSDYNAWVCSLDNKSCNDTAKIGYYRIRAFCRF